MTCSPFASASDSRLSRCAGHGVEDSGGRFCQRRVHVGRLIDEKPS